jgi:hypothetical protein
LLDFLDFVEKIVGLPEETSPFVGGFDHVGFTAIEKIEVGVVVLGLDLNGILQVADTLVNQGALFRDALL